MWLSRLLLACAGSDVEPFTPGEPCEQVADFDGTVSYHPDRLLCVQLTMDPVDFDALGREQRWGTEDADLWNGVVSQVISSCTEPFPDPYTWFEGTLSVQGETVERVGIRKKGFVGSALKGAKPRPSLKVKTDRFVEDQLLGTTERLTLNNNLTDGARMRTCLTYSVFADAGYPAARCNLANVMMNGTSLGAYSHVEPMKKRFLRRAFGDDEGSLYEATVADFTLEHLADGLGRWEAKTGATDASAEPLVAVARALEASDDQLEEALEEVLDLDAFFTFWALETLLAHQDGYTGNTNNSYVYFDPGRGGRAVMIPWGPDDAMVADTVAFDSSWLAYRLARHPELYGRFLDELQRVLDEVWDEERVLERIDRMEAQLATVEEPNEAVIEALRGFVRGRRDAIDAFVAAGGRVPPERESTCSGPLNGEDLAALGELNSSFAIGCSTTEAVGFHGWLRR